MQTFLKMSSVIYSMAGLGTIEESKVYREKFPSEDSSTDSLKDEINEQLPKDVSNFEQISMYVIPYFFFDRNKMDLKLKKVMMSLLKKQ